MVASLLLLAAVFGALQLLASGSSPTAPADAARVAADATLGKLSLNFIENRGQIDRRAEYYLPGKDASVYFRRDGLSLSLAEKGRTGRRYGLKLDFVGARADARPVGRAKTPTVVSYFKGAPEDWKAGIPTYSEVAYPNLWPGIDLVYSGAGSQLKYSFLVKPGGDPAAIQLAWQGASGVSLTSGGRLRVSTPPEPSAMMHRTPTRRSTASVARSGAPTRSQPGTATASGWGAMTAANRS